MENKEFIDAARDLGARLFALQAGLMAVMRIHPQPQALAKELDLCGQAAQSNMEALPWSEENLQTFHATMALLKSQTLRR